jgi:uncharacterized membrane protein
MSEPTTDKVERQGRAGRHLVRAVALFAVVTAAAFIAGAQWPVALGAGWLGAALVIAEGIWRRIRRMDAAATAANAQQEDYSRATSDLVVLSASVASLVTVGFTLVEARDESGASKGLLILLAVAVVAASWLAIHLIFTVRYGDLYYDDPVGGVSFNENEPPDYRDFLYLAFTIGMTFQISDTDISSKVIRRQVTRHALLSYLFGAVIVALAINTVATLLQ